MPGRQFNLGSYRYGFNGMENDNEIKGLGNHVDFGARGYDPRLGRWWTVDPKFAQQPGWSPYKFALCNPL
jgi:RHS repeat-associated protein